MNSRMILKMLSALYHCLMMVWFFRKIEAYDFRRFLLSFLVLPLYVVLAMTLNQAYDVLMHVVLLLCAVLFLSVGRKGPLGNNLYFGLLFSNSLLTMRICVYSVLIKVMGMDSGYTSRIVFWIFLFVEMTIMSGIIRFDRTDGIPFYMYLLQIMVTVMLFYIRQVARSTEIITGGSSFLAYYPLLLSFIVSIFMISLDSLCMMREEQVKLNIINEAMNKEYQRMSEQLTAVEDIKHVYHDIKNHLLILKNSSSEEYVDSLLAQMHGYENLPSTKNQTLDNLLNLKLPVLKKNHISLTVNADLSLLDYISPPDMVSIFGNALDNAIEATCKVETEHRYINLKSGIVRESLVIRFINTFDGKFSVSQNGNLKTLKDSLKGHGIGMVSMKSALEKYHGTYSYQVSDERNFSLVIVFPMNS